MISSTWVIEEIFRPLWPSPPIRRIEISSASTLGISVTRAAGTERNTTSSSTITNRIENVCTCLPALLELAWLATAVAIWPETWSWSPAGAPECENVAWSASMIALSFEMSFPPNRTRTRISAACRSEDTPSSVEDLTDCTSRASDASRAIACRSALVSGPEREATIVTSPTLPVPPPPRTGFASVAAFWLGELEGRNALLLLLTSLPRDGSAALVTTATRIQKATIAQRKRTTKRASASNIRSTDSGIGPLCRFPRRASSSVRLNSTYYLGSTPAL